MKATTEKILKATLRADDSITEMQGAKALAALSGKQTPEATAGEPVAVRQARVCEMLDCSRFHVRKLERLGLLKPVELAGLRRYAVSDVMNLFGGEV